MNKREYLLTKMIEECLEVAQRATKALTFGCDEVQPGQDLNNMERINLEWNDLIATVEMVGEECGHALYGEAKLIEAKRAKIEKFMEYSREQGTLV